MPTVFVIAKDWNLRGAVRAELLERGVEALGMETTDDAAKASTAGTLPNVIVLDSACANMPAAVHLARRFPVLLVASRTETLPQFGAVSVLWRPVAIHEIVECISQLLKGRAA